MPKFDPKTQVDYVIIGSGAAGGVMAKELSSAGFKVVVLEQGPYLRNKDFAQDEWKVRQTSSLVNDHKLQPNTFRKSEQEKATVAESVSYGRCVGGGTVHYTGTQWRMRESDFKERTRFGSIAKTGFDDWPIAYSDLEPYYNKAEWDLGVSTGGGSVGDSPRSKAYPLPSMPIKSSGVLFERGAKKLGYHPVTIPSAVLSQPYDGRQACNHCGFCEWFGCTIGAKSSTLVSVIPKAEKTGHCEIRPNSYVREISVDKSGRATGVIYFDSRKREIFQKAKAVVVCANGTETPRLLLMSKSNLFPNGLANSSGIVGKYLMFGGTSASHGIFEHALNDYKSINATRAIEDFYEADAKRGFYGGGRLDGRWGFMGPIGYAMQGIPPDVPRWGAAFKNHCKDYFNRTMSVFAYCTSLPVETNSISLDPDLKDAWGLPAMRVTYKDHPDGLKTKQFFVDRGLEVLEAAGAMKKWGDPVNDSRGSAHLMGTCRMGDDPKTSVVDKNNRAHDVPNLFLVDGSSFVTSGRNHPTCTIQALAYRLADHLIHASKTGSIPSAL